MNDQFTIYIFPHLRKWMAKTFEHEKGIFLATEYNTLGRLITLCLKDNTNKKDRYFHADQAGGITGKLQIKLSTYHMRLSPRISKLNRINNALDTLFKEHLITWIRAQYESGIYASTACRHFLEYHGIDPDGTQYNLDAAYKVWQRKKDKTQSEDSLQSLS